MISAVFSSMDREKNLIESLNSWIDNSLIKEFILVDWSSKEPLYYNREIQNLLEKYSNKIICIRVVDEKNFSLSMSYNLGFNYTKSEYPILLKLDSDYKSIDSSWMYHLKIKNNQLDNYCIRGHWKFALSMSGFLLINKKDFPFYNEHLQGWGYDDDDLFTQLKNVNIVIFSTINSYIKHIEHSDHERTVNYVIKNKFQSQQQNKELCNLTNKNRYFATYKEILRTPNYIELKREK